ncbi:hypothetical protein WMY93_017685 [Mugilogobius chulae]|uniref:C2H2-type domain-containing protein n=1 Tax=Mugilogobius chulae TaxID=88201 RepID=A0AAW0NQ12_9GOBI
MAEGCELALYKSLSLGQSGTRTRVSRAWCCSLPSEHKPTRGVLYPPLPLLFSLSGAQTRCRPSSRQLFTAVTLWPFGADHVENPGASVRNATLDVKSSYEVQTRGISHCSSSTMVIDSPMLNGSSDGPQSRLCSECGCTFSSTCSLSSQSIKCTSCERSRSGDGRRRQRRARLEPHSCHVCQKTFISSAHLKLHLASHGKERKFRCMVCDKNFKQKSHLIAHKLIHTGERPFKCPECGKCFGRSAHLKTHRRIHSGEKPFQCSICGKSFTQKSGLMAHIPRHAKKKLSKSQKQQPPTGPDDLKCGVCCRTFVRSSYYRLGQRLRKGYRPYHCRVCNKTFAKLETFGNHCDKHLQEKEKKEELEERNISLSPQSFNSESVAEIHSSTKAKTKIKTES